MADEWMVPAVFRQQAPACPDWSTIKKADITVGTHFNKLFDQYEVVEGCLMHQVIVQRGIRCTHVAVGATTKIMISRASFDECAAFCESQLYRRRQDRKPGKRQVSPSE
jgi:hypothetical protein